MNIKIKNAQVLLSVPEFHIVTTSLFIRDGRISVLGETDEKPDKIIDGKNKLVMPGLMNCHTHMYMSLFRNFADDLAFHTWLFDKIMPIEDKMEAEDAYWINLLSCMEMIQSGTTSFLDMHMFKNQNLRAASESGMRAILSRGLVGPNAEEQGAINRINEAFEEKEAMQLHKGLIRCMLGPHAIYTCGSDLLRHLVSVAKKENLRLHIHLAETKKEFDDCMEENGCTPTEFLDSIGFFEVPTVAAHCVYVTDKDIEILAKNKVNVVTNPLSNMKLGNGFAPVGKFLDAGINVCLGTDSVASNNNLNLFKEMSFLSCIHKGLEKDPQALPAAQVLRCATMNGALAVGLEDQIGSIEVGKKADLLLLDLSKPQFMPANNLVAALVYSASGAEVETVLIDGKIVMENYEIKTIDQERVAFEMERIRNKYLV